MEGTPHLANLFRKLTSPSSLVERRWKLMRVSVKRRPAAIITSEEGQVAQKKMWGEIVEVLEEKYPGLVKSCLGN
jgi:hypothetical protein